MNIATKKGEKCDVNNDEKVNKKSSSLEKSYFDVLGLCCSSEVPLIEKILKPLEGVVEVSVIVPSRTVIVVHDPLLISQQQIVKALNQARLEANVRVIGKASYRGKWPSPYVICSGLLLALSLLQYVYHPLQWLAVAAVVVGIWPILIRGAIAIKNFTLDVNILMLIAVVGTLVLRDYLEAGTIVFLFTIAEWLESRASQKATAVMSSLLSMTPQNATIAETGEVVNVKDVKLNTILAVKAGELIPIDGIVVEGTCEVDEKTITGESFPVPKQIDSNVLAGTVNINGYVSVKTTSLAEDCAVAKMARLVEEAQNNKSSVQRLIDKCAKYYTPAVVLISAALAVVPIAMKVHDRKHWFYLALVVLVSACPCGLILSTPVATFCALSRAATSGLLIKGGDYLELLAKVKHIAFDKTGTLTRGEFTLKDFQSLADGVPSKTLLYWVSSIESKSSHPIATVLVEYGRSQGIEPKPENVDNFQNFPGEGVFGTIDGRDLYIGNQKLGQRANCSVASNVDYGNEKVKEARTCGYIYYRGAVIGTFSLSDDCRSGAFEALKELKSMGVRIAMLTGDSRSTALRAQEQLGKALDAVHAELLPEDKARIITGYKQQGPTAMVGDGVNDAPALATADIGISMGVSGSALATETGHVVLMSNDIRKIPKAVKLARTTRRKVIENIIFSITTKAGVLAVAVAGHPLVWLAVLVDVATCLIVIGNSMLLLGGSGHSTHKKSRCFGWFTSCHSHKTECCSKNEAAKTCGGTKCSSPCQKPKCESLGDAKCSSLSCQATNPKPCCATTTCLTTIPDSCESAACSSSIGNCAEKSQQCCPVSFTAEEISESPDYCQTVCQADAHDTDENHCHSHDCASECESADQHSSNTCKSDYLDLLESQVTSCVKHSPSEFEHHHHHDHNHGHDNHHNHGHDNHHHHGHDHHHHHDHGHHHHHEHSGSTHQHCEQKTSCENTDEEKVKCEGGQDEITTSKHQYSPSVPHNDNKNKSKHDHCASSHEVHHHQHHVGHHHHHHHHVTSHTHCHAHANELTKHACSSLRKREIGACCKSFRQECCSAQGRLGPAFGGLTEIVTE